jgi:PAS domain S-box-containing protein
LKGSELRSFIEQAPVAMAMFDREMRYVAVSRRWLDERNLDGSVIGRSAYEVFPDIDSELRALHLRALAGETITRDEDRFEIAHGSVQWVRYEIRPWRESDGQIGGIVVFAEDITARKQVEETLRKSEERFRYAMDAAQDGIWDWDLRTNRAACSPAYLRMLGYEIGGWETIDVEFWTDLLHPDDRERTAASAQALLKDLGRFELEFRLRAKDGSYRCIMSRAKVVERDEWGAPVRAVGTHTDITERKAVEEALRQSEAKVRKQHEELEAIYQYAPIGLASFDTDLRYRRINQRLAEIGGLPPEAHIGRTIRETVPAMAPQIEVAAKAVLAGQTFVSGREISGETRAQPGVMRYFNDHWYTVFDAEGKVSGCGVVVDEITERKKIELELQQISERLELAQSAAKVGIWDWNLLSNEAFVNDQWRMIFGVDENAPLSYESFVARVHPDDREAYLEMVGRGFSGGGQIEGETRIIREKDGVTRWVTSKGEVFFDSDGKAIRAMGAVWDVTTLKEAQEAMLQRSEDRYRRIIETAQEGV